MKFSIVAAWEMQRLSRKRRYPTTDTTRIELSRESEAADLERFVDELGLHARRDGTVIEIVDAADDIGDTVTAWLAEWHEPLVPTELVDRTLALRPPAA